MSITPEGKAVSSQNALKSGLFAARHFIRVGEEAEYAQTLESLLRDLSPEGILEETFTTEIMGATWRLRRCGLIESAFEMIEDETLLEKQQKSVDRARAQSHSILRRSMNELRKLQTERRIRLELNTGEICGLADCKQILNAIKLHAAACASFDAANKPAAVAEKTAAPDSDLQIKAFEQMLQRELGFTDRMPLAYDFDESAPGSFCKPQSKPAPPPASSFCNPPAFRQAVSSKVPRNALCPCGSGVKYKKCCGGPAAPEVKQAA